MQILVKITEEDVTIKIDADEYFGLAYESPLDEEYEERGMIGGSVSFAEITVPKNLAKELRDILLRELG